jgi:hypothetical protein
LIGGSGELLAAVVLELDDELLELDDELLELDDALPSELPVEPLSELPVELLSVLPLEPGPPPEDPGEGALEWPFACE